MKTHVSPPTVFFLIVDELGAHHKTIASQAEIAQESKLPYLLLPAGLVSNPYSS